MSQETPGQRAAATRAAIMNEKQANELVAFGELPLEHAWNNARDSINGTAEITLKRQKNVHETEQTRSEKEKNNGNTEL